MKSDPVAKSCNLSICTTSTDMNRSMVLMAKNNVSGQETEPSVHLHKPVHQDRPHAWLQSRSLVQVVGVGQSFALELVQVRENLAHVLADHKRIICVLFVEVSPSVVLAARFLVVFRDVEFFHQVGAGLCGSALSRQPHKRVAKRVAKQRRSRAGKRVCSRKGPRDGLAWFFRFGRPFSRRRHGSGPSRMSRVCGNAKSAGNVA
ncbi:hypothetical protein CLUG_03287 [Clavispora lusitaniae ATCC 42720]|uniref:Uncharacterized protein n=1 Tax=Clavispora lusitaniae (strain ATCC 42720) TaxID=306902 RepID=C4Y553_CLAL4|nr:uncharacterized protein CLUG_03287 [Clavispora lusitaniae ATCC 42720]EEQ39160.1 hypothetical protein CLUG_03287 [Clavispora lusitaniae ATCC 42720]